MPFKDAAKRYEAVQKWRKAHPETVKGYSKKHFLMRRTGCSIEEYNAKFAKQEGCCAICGRHQSEFKRAFAVDHDHETGQLRDLLCGACNPALGAFQDNQGILEAAIVYLKKWAVVKEENENP